jgi:hypothetical protein
MLKQHAPQKKHGSLTKWLIPSLEQDIQTMILEHFVLTKHEEIILSLVKKNLMQRLPLAKKVQLIVAIHELIVIILIINYSFVTSGEC